MGLLLAPSDEGAVERLRETGGEKYLSCFLSLRHLLRKCHLPRQREAFRCGGPTHSHSLFRTMGIALGFRYTIKKSPLSVDKSDFLLGAEGGI